MVERLRRTVKYEEEYLKSYRDMVELRAVPLQNRQPGPTTACSRQAADSERLPLTNPKV